MVVPRIGRWFFRNVDEESYFEFLFAMAVLFGTAFLAQIIGAEPIIGAFLAGVTMNRLVPSTGTLQNRIDFMGDALFVPFFFLSTGMIVQPALFLRGLEPWLVAGTILLVMFGMKLVAAWLTGRIYGYDRAEWLAMYGLSTGQAAAALAVATIGANIGLFGETIVNGVVLMIVVTGIVSPYLSRRYGQQVARAEERAEYDPSEAPERILIPLTEYTDITERLLDLAMAIRESDSEEPIHAVTVVEREDHELDVGDRYTGTRPSESTADQRAGDETDEKPRTDDASSEEVEAEIADAEAALEATEEQAASAEVPIDTQTRVEDSVVTGIVRAIEENRITTVVMGPTAHERFGQRLFGSTVDQVLERTNELVAVADLDEPLNATERVVVLLPGRIATHPGFFEGIHTAKHVAEQLGVPVKVLLVGGNRDRYEQLIDSVTPDTSFEMETLSGWGQLRSSGEEHLETGDLLVALTPRAGGRGWESELQRLPRRLAEQAPENVIVLYLSEADESRTRRFLRMS